jgi:pyrimidine operon attenuation protein/uracil phosphoribosyltransferase
MAAPTLVLNKEMVSLKIQRVAWEIYEKHANEQALVVVGISKSGYWLAEQIVEKLRNISELNILLCEMQINKKEPWQKDVKMNIEVAQIKNKCVVLVDDVLNSGSVLIHGVRHLLEQPLHRLTTTVLVDRNHKRFPVKADVKGISLSTSIQEHVEVRMVEGGAEVYLK